MRKSTALTQIVKEAKHLKRKYPTRFNSLRKKDRWSKGYIKQASAIYASKHGEKKSTPAKKKTTRKKIAKAPGHAIAKRKITKRTVTRKKSALVVRTKKGRYSVYTIGAKKRRTRKRHAAKRTISGTHRRRSVGKKGSGMLLGVLVGAAALYLLSRGSSGSRSNTGAYQLPPLTQTGNYTRNTQSQDIVNYAMAAGLAIDAITKLIDRLNRSSDQEVSNMHEVVNTTGDIGVLV